MELHGGTIAAYSAGRDKGATFSVRLPLAAPAAYPEERPPTGIPQHVVRPLHILLVEDHGVTAEMMATALARTGHTVERAGDLATALDLANHNSFDLLLSDLGLPDGSGHDLMRQLRDRGHTFPGIALSGYGQEEDIQRSREVGFASHLTKPASHEVLLSAIAAVVTGRERDSAGAPPAQGAAPTFTFDEALRRCLGKHELLDKVIAFFFDDMDKLLPEVRLALQRGDIFEVERLAHRLKGTVTHLAAERASEAAADVEHIARSDTDRAALEDKVKTMEQEFEALKTVLNEYGSVNMRS